MADTWIAGGRGTMADASNENGGGFIQGGTATYLTCQGVNGGPTSVGTWNGLQDACTVTDDGYGFIKITGPGANPFANCVNGSLVYIEFSAVYANDWYQVLQHTNTTVEVGEAYVSDSDCDCNVGGAFAADGTGIATAITLIAAGDEVNVASNPISGKEYDVATTITIPAVTGTSANKIIIKGVNYSDGSDLLVTDVKPTLIAVAGLGANPIILLNSGTSEYYKWMNITFDAANIGNYCVYNSVTSTYYHTFYRCNFKNSISYGIRWNTGSYFHRLIECNIYNNDSSGILLGNYAYLNDCYSYKNGNRGFTGGSQVAYDKCVAYGNTSDGFNLGANSTIDNCIGYNNGASGLLISDAITYVVVTNNSFVNNTIYGINLDGIDTAPILLNNNHCYNNTTAHYSEGADSTWADFQNGNNITGDPKFISTTEGSENFDLLFDSPLQRNGINNTTIGAGTREEITEGRQDVAFQAIYIQPEDVS